MNLKEAKQAMRARTTVHTDDTIQGDDADYGRIVDIDETDETATIAWSSGICTRCDLSILVVEP